MATEHTAGAGLVAPGTGVIHDIGYQTYDGPRFGRGKIAIALCWHSFRSAFGFGRGAKAKILPVFAFVIMGAPAGARLRQRPPGLLDRRGRDLPVHDLVADHRTDQDLS